MFIKNIIFGVLGLIGFPLSYLVINNINFITLGITVSLLLIAYYFVNVYVIGKRKSFFTITSSWIAILMLTLPFSLITTATLKVALLYIGIFSTFLTWFFVLIEFFLSETFKGH